MEEFLHVSEEKLQLREVIEQILYAYQQNAVCRELSEEEHKIQHEQNIQFLKSLDMLKTQCECKQSMVNRIYVLRKDTLDITNENKTHLHSKIKKSKYEFEIMDKMYKDIDYKLTACIHECIQAEKRQAVAENRYETLRKKIKVDKDKLNNYLWIPVYNFLQEFEIQLHDAQAKTAYEKKHYTEACESRKSIEKKHQEIKHRYDLSKLEQCELQHDYEQLQHKTEIIEEQMELLKKELSIWRLILNNMNALYKQIENANVNLDEIKAMQEELSKLG